MTFSGKKSVEKPALMPPVEGPVFFRRRGFGGAVKTTREIEIAGKRALSVLIRDFAEFLGLINGSSLREIAFVYAQDCLV